jgi:hypothetical protein
MNNYQNGLSDSPKKFILLVDRAETVIISFFSNTIEEVISDVNDNYRNTILIFVIFVAWMLICSYFDLFISKLWYNDTSENKSMQSENKIKLLKAYNSNKPWHEILSKIKNFITYLLYYLVIQFFLKSFLIAWQNENFGNYEIFILIIIFIISIYTIYQILFDISNLDVAILSILKDLEDDKFKN